MKRGFAILRYTIVVILSLILIANITGNQFLVRGIWATYLHGYNSASIGDARFFDQRTIDRAEDTRAWRMSAYYNQRPLSQNLKDVLKASESVAFLVIRNNEVVQEHYWDDFSETSQSNSFSMAKSVVSMLTQIAIQKGHLEGWDQKVTDFFPDLTGEYASELELWHLATMSSGMDWNEHYTNAFGITARAYYGTDLWELMKGLPIIDKPGQQFVYQSGSPQLLAMVLIKATGRHLSDLASDWLWKPMGAEHSASWHIDDIMGTELAYCCINSNARDFARFGKLMLNHGNWEGEQLIDSSWTEIATKGALAPQYGYAFWIDDSHDTHIFYQRGILGQYIIVIPEFDAVVVRLGHHRLKHRDAHSEDFHIIVEEVLAMMDNPE